MKYNRALLALGLVLVLVCAPTLAHDHDGDDDDDHDDDDNDMMMTFVSELYAENQVPPLTERDVDDAEAKLKLWSTPQGYRWKFEISDVVNMTMAHIHMGNSSTNGPVIVPILPLNASMSEFADGNLAMISPPISGDFEYEGLITTDNFLGPLEGMTLDDFMMVLMSGDAYANIHSVEYPAGLIRGQFEVDH